MTTIGSSFTSISSPQPRIRKIGEADLNWALAEGWKDFKDKRGDLIVLALIYPVVGLVAAVLSFNSERLALFFPLVAGLSILGPAVASGFYELARRREAGLESSWLHFLDPLRGRGRASLAIMTAGLLALFAGWILTASLIYAVTLGGYHPASLRNFVGLLFTTPEGWSMVIIGNLVGFGFAVLTLALTLVSFPMVVDQSVDPITAISASVHAVTDNPKAAASWGLRVAGLLALGCLPLFIGLAVALPVLGYASWHLYTRLVER
jgi:uncharacterized membrane protein